MADITSLSDEEFNALSAPAPQAKPDITQVPDDEFNSWQTTVKESDFKEAPPPLEKPNFVKKAEMLASGLAQGLLEFGARLLNNVSNIGSGATKGTSLEQPKEESYATAAYDYWDKKNEADYAKYEGAGLYQGMGKIGGELLATAPVGGAVGLVSKVAGAAGKAVPYGAKKIVEYGLAGAANGALLAGLEGARYDPKNPDHIEAANRNDQTAHYYEDPELLQQLQTRINNII